MYCKDIRDPVKDPGYSVCQRTCPAENFGGKDSVKENRQGCLSRSIKSFFKLFESLKTQAACQKDFFDKLDIRDSLQNPGCYFIMDTLYCVGVILVCDLKHLEKY